MKPIPKQALALSIIVHLALFLGFGFFYKMSINKNSEVSLKAQRSKTEQKKRSKMQGNSETPNNVIDPNDNKKKEEVKKLVSEVFDSVEKMNDDKKMDYLKDKNKYVKGIKSNDLDDILGYVGGILNIKAKQKVNAQKPDELKRGNTKLIQYTDHNWQFHDIKKINKYYYVDMVNDSGQLISTKSLKLDEDTQRLFTVYEMGRGNENLKKLVDFTMSVMLKMHEGGDNHTRYSKPKVEKGKELR
jgi:hypothetical protein